MVCATGAERLSLDFQPVTKTGAALFLWDAADPPTPRCVSAQIRLCVTDGSTKGVGRRGGRARHAASCSLSVGATGRLPLLERKPRRKSAALLAWDAARTLARL